MGSISLPVVANFKIGIAARSNNSLLDDYVLEFLLQEELENPHNIFLDPCVYYLHYYTGISDSSFSSQPLFVDLTKPFAGPVIKDRRLLYVGKNGASREGFLTPQDATPDLQVAINEANDGDFVIIIDNEAYNVNEIISVWKEISIIGLSNTNLLSEKANYYNSDNMLSPKPAIVNHPLITTNENTKLMVIGDYSEQVIEIPYIISIINIGFTNGVYEFRLLENASPEGGGAMVVMNDKVYIRNCLFENNKSISNESFILTRVPIPWPEWTAREYGFGGAVLNYYSSAFYYGNLFIDNVTKRRGGAIAVWGYGWPTIINNIFHGNIATNYDGVDIDTCKADGGAIAIENGVSTHLEFGTVIAIVGGESFSFNPNDLIKLWDYTNYHTKIYFNLFTLNKADSGGALYITTCANINSKGNIFKRNVANLGGGAIRISFACTCYLTNDKIIENETERLVKKKEGGGGIQLRTSNLFLKSVEVERNISRGWAGGGIFFNSTTDGYLFGQRSHVFDFNDFTTDVFKQTEFTLSIDEKCKIQDNKCEYTSGDEGDPRKGGGIYIARTDIIYWFNTYWGPVKDFTPLPIYITIKNASIILNNHLTSDSQNPQGSPTPQFPNATNFYLEDRINTIDDHPLIIDDNSVGSGLFFYPLQS